MNASDLVTVPPGAVTVKARADPALPGGVRTLICVELSTTNDAAATPPSDTDVVPTKFVPVIVIVSPPAADPESCHTLVMVGAAGPVADAGAGTKAKIAAIRAIVTAEAVRRDLASRMFVSRGCDFL